MVSQTFSAVELKIEAHRALKVEYVLLFKPMDKPASISYIHMSIQIQNNVDNSLLMLFSDIPLSSTHYTDLCVVLRTVLLLLYYQD